METRSPDISNLYLKQHKKICERCPRDVGQPADTPASAPAYHITQKIVDGTIPPIKKFN